MNTTSPKHLNDREIKWDKLYDYIAISAITISYGMVGLTLGILTVLGDNELSFSKIIIIGGIVGFIIGSGFGLWHAIWRWKRNDSQMAEDGDLK
jgi:hypothetical protein